MNELMIFWLINIHKWMICWLLDVTNGWWVDLWMFPLTGSVGVVTGHPFDTVKVGHFRQHSITCTCTVSIVAVFYMDYFDMI